jgi:hypothetical protein
MTEPSRRDRTRPAELLGLSAVLAVVTGTVTYFGTRNLLLAAEFTGVAFIVSLVGFAMLLLAVSPKRDDDDASDNSADDAPGGH